MSPAQDDAALLLLEAARTGRRLAALPAHCKPATTDEALAAQARLVALSGEEVAGWKVATDPAGQPVWGAIFRRDCLPTPARIAQARVRLMGIEGEIAFRLDRSLPARAGPYTRAEIEASVTAFPAIEIVASRFEDYGATPFLDRLVDRMSNGAMVLGVPREDWRSLMLSKLHVSLQAGTETLVERSGGHARIDPLLPAIEFIHVRQRGEGLGAGQFITTGTYTGLLIGEVARRYTVRFEHFEQVETTFY